MNVKIEDLVTRSVITTQPHVTIGHVKDIFKDNKIQSIPIVDKDKKVLGIATVSDVLGMKDTTPISKVMSEKVFTVPLYSDISTAARVMRNHHIHHVLVTHEQETIGVLSAYDLLELVEDHRFIMKNAPTLSKKKAQRQ